MLTLSLSAYLEHVAPPGEGSDARNKEMQCKFLCTHCRECAKVGEKTGVILVIKR